MVSRRDQSCSPATSTPPATSPISGFRRLRPGTSSLSPEGSGPLHAGPTPKPPPPCGIGGPDNLGEDGPLRPSSTPWGQGDHRERAPVPRVKEAQLLHQCLYMAASGRSSPALPLDPLHGGGGLPELGPEAVISSRSGSSPTVINDLHGGDFYLRVPHGTGGGP